MALSDCFNNYIGIENTCSDTVSESGIYATDLPGIGLKLMANIADEDTKDFTTLWNQVYQRTLNQLESDILVKAQKYFKTNILLENTNTGYYQDPYVTVSSSDEYKGTTIEVPFNTSRYLSIFVNSVQMYLPTAVNSNIYVYNLMNGVLLDTIAFTGLVGMNTIEINKSYKSYGQDTKIFICYDGNVTDSIIVDTVDQSYLAITRGAKIATTGTSILKDNLTFDNDSYGLIANYNIRCDITEFICSSKDAFKYALWWKLGANIMFERMISTRLNKYTLDMTKLQQKQLMDDYNDEYDKIIASVMDNLQANNDNICFSCEKKRNYKNMIP